MVSDLLPQSSTDKVHELIGLSYQFIRAGELEKAQAHLLKASEIEPENIQIWSNLGVIAKKSQHYKSAVDYYNQGLKIDPENTNLLSNIGSLLLHIKDFSQAIHFTKKALSIDQNLPNAWNNLGSCYFHCGRYEQSQACYEKAYRLNPNNPTVAFNLSGCLLRLGEFQRGFALYEYRFTKDDEKAMVKNIHSPRWQQQSIIEQPKAKICLTCEQGFGDTIQFIRFIPRLLNMALFSKVQLIVHIQPECQSLIAQSYPDLKVIANTEPEPKTSLFHIPLMSLPLLCRLDPLNIPHTSYLQIAKEQTKKWQGQLPLSAESIAIGVVWKGSPTNFSAGHRSIEFDQFITLFADCPKAVQLVHLSVQQEPHQQLLDWLKNKPSSHANITLKEPKKNIENFADTATLIQQLDLVISIDTAVLHLSGALGQETFALIPFAHDWRWFRHIQYSPWYPTMRLIRQQKWQVWDSALFTLKTLLHQWLSKQEAKRTTC